MRPAIAVNVEGPTQAGIGALQGPLLGVRIGALAGSERNSPLGCLHVT